VFDRLWLPENCSVPEEVRTRSTRINYPQRRSFVLVATSTIQERISLDIKLHLQYLSSEPLASYCAVKTGVVC